MKKKPKKSHNKRHIRNRHPNIARYADMMGKRMTKAERSFYYTVKPVVRRMKKQRIIECKGKTYIADFYVGCARLVIEIDGDNHKQQAEYDDERTRKMNAIGLKVIRFRNELALNDPHYCLSIVSQWIFHRINGNTLTPDAASHEHRPAIV